MFFAGVEPSATIDSIKFTEKGTFLGVTCLARGRLLPRPCGFLLDKNVNSTKTRTISRQHGGSLV